jgi:hypothetical protein
MVTVQRSDSNIHCSPHSGYNAETVTKFVRVDSANFMHISF